MANIAKIWTDGACLGNTGSSPGGWAFLIVNDSPAVPNTIGSHHESNTTNNRMELTAIINGIKSAASRGYDKFEVYTDSQLSVDTQRWMLAWERKGWKKKDGKEPKNLDLIQDFFTLNEIYDINMNWVKAHSGIEYNELVDKLASDEANKISEPRAKATKKSVKGTENLQMLSELIKTLKKELKTHGDVPVAAFNEYNGWTSGINGYVYENGIGQETQIEDGDSDLYKWVKKNPEYPVFVNASY